MLSNFLLIAWRNLKRNRTYAIVNVAGLGLAIGCCLTTIVTLRHELSFDQFHQKADRTYRVVRHSGWGTTGITPYATGSALRTDFPELTVTQVHGPQEYKISVPESNGSIRPFKEKNLLFADSYFLQMFDFRWQGPPNYEVLQEPSQVLLTVKAAQKYFPGQDPVGKTLLLADSIPLTVGGVLANPPANTNTPFFMIISYVTLDRLHPGMRNDWYMTWKGLTYVTLPEGGEPTRYTTGLKHFEEKYLQAKASDLPVLHLQPLRKVHTEARYGGGTHYVLPTELMWAFLLLGSIVMITACVNFVNLNTAQAALRAKEVGLRKSIGSTRFQLIGQFLTETGLLVIVATLLGLTLGQFLIARWNSLLSIVDYNLSMDISLLPYVAALAVFITLVAGFYPAWIMSGYSPVLALKNQLLNNKASGNYRLRKTLVVMQFAFSNLLIIGTLIAAAQLKYAQESDLGFRKESVVLLEVPQGREAKLEGFREALTRIPGVGNVSFGSAAPLANSNSTTIFWVAGQSDKEGKGANRKAIDERYLDLFGINLVAGENVRPRPSTDTTLQVLVNEDLVRKSGFSHPSEAVGRVLTFDDNRRGTIVGVVRDFYHRSFREAMEPIILLYQPAAFTTANITIASPDHAATTKKIEERFRAFFPDSVFVHQWFDEQIALIYVVESLLYRLFGAISFIAVAIGMLGLYGLVSFMAVRRSKEIGIRKVMGAGVLHVMRLFLAEYAILLVIAFVVAAPLIYFVMQLWLQGFQYKIPLSPLFFAGGFLLSCLITLLTVGQRTWRAATANPVDSLRNE
jgi:ABC-type lipoprotein release transport system permease subunit